MKTDGKVRPEKQYMIDEIRRLTTGSEFVFLLDYTGISVRRMSEFKKKLRAVGAEVHVVRNRLFGIVAAERGWGDRDELTRKPTAMLTGKDDIAAAKIVKEFAKVEEKPIGIKGGVLKGVFLPAEDVLAMASLPPRKTLEAMLVGTIAAPMSRLVGAMNQKLSSLVYVLQAVEKKKGG